MMPRPLLIGLFVLTIIPMLAGFLVPGAVVAGTLLCLVLVLVSLIDIVISPRLDQVEVYRDCGDVVSVGARNAVRIWARNLNRRPLRVEIHDEYPQPAAVEDLPVTLDLSPGRTCHATWYLIPEKRGLCEFGRLYVQTRSRLGLWTLISERPQTQPIKVYPDIQAVASVELLARQNRLAEAGIRLSRLRGRGSEFDRLREYRRADEFRQIDWKATARKQELVSREYVVERNQNILFLLDCGRSMCNSHEGIRHFDRALNAVILLSHVALRQGDTVGVLACSNRLQRWVPPVRGTLAVQKIVRQVYDLEPTYEASDYGLIAEEVRRRNRKRSLVILVTHVLDDVHLEAISTHLRLLRSPHLVMGAFLANEPLRERLDALPENGLDAFQIAAAAEMVGQQSQQVAQLQQEGLLVIESSPGALSAALISQYLEIKARHLL